MQKTLDLIRAFAREEDGVTAMEYGLIAGFLSLVIVGGLTIGGPALKGIFDSIGTQLAAAKTAMG
jgi:pilus assembly protein Flp/PilA